jgi:hypothetical protein
MAVGAGALEYQACLGAVPSRLAAHWRVCMIATVWNELYRNAGQEHKREAANE